jgi:hypothetical protein
MSFACTQAAGGASSDPTTGSPNGADDEVSTGKAGDTTPKAAPDTTTAEPASATGIVFLHGTSDMGTAPSIECTYAGDQFRCAVPKAVSEYWPRETVESMRERADGTKRPFAVLGCPLASQTPWPNASPVVGSNKEPGSAVCVGAQINRFMNGPDGLPNTADDIKHLAIVTHSGGANVVRYILQQHTASPEFARVHAASRLFVALAAPTRGTYLANAVFHSTGLIGFGSLMARAAGENAYDDDGTAFIQTNSMEAFNRDPAKLVNLDKDVAGVPALVGSGSNPDGVGDAKSACGGSSESSSLQILHDRYLSSNDAKTVRDGCSDGFVTCQSAMALANGDKERVIFGRLDDGTVIGDPHFRNHNQSRQSCNDTDVDVRNAINKWLAKPLAATPPAKNAMAQTRALSHAFSFAPTRFALANDVAIRITPDIARVQTTHAHRDAEGVELTVDVTSFGAQRLGVRADLVATSASGESWTVAQGQTSLDAADADHTVSLRLPADQVPANAKLSVRNVTLIAHDRAEVADQAPVVDVE